jgi:ribonuclease R
VGELSLNKGVERRAITVEMTINMLGGISAYEIYPSTIVVKDRYSYEEFADLAHTLPFSWLQSFAEKHKETLPLAIPGLALTVDESGCLTDLNAVHSNDVAHRMISCAMIAANFTVSAHLTKKGVLLPNRFHETPNGLFQSDIEAVTHNPVVDSFLAVKKWRPARYDLHASGHFGLGIPSYVHFTSPMRRYPDVLVHRILAGVQYSFESLTKKIDAINDRAINVRGLQKYYTSLKIARYLEIGQHLRSVYIIGVSRAGVQWYSPDYLINGFCHVSKIGKGIRWDFDGSSLHSNGVHLRVGELLNVESVAYDFSSCKYEIVCE